MRITWCQPLAGTGPREDRMNFARKATATGFMSLALLGVAVPAQAQPPQQDGLVNVNVGNVTVPIGVAAQIAANACGIKVGPVAVLARAVDRGGPDEVVCTADQSQTGEDVIITTN